MEAAETVWNADLRSGTAARHAYRHPRGLRRRLGTPTSGRQAAEGREKHAGADSPGVIPSGNGAMRPQRSRAWPPDRRRAAPSTRVSRSRAMPTGGRRFKPAAPSRLLADPRNCAFTATGGRSRHASKLQRSSAKSASTTISSTVRGTTWALKAKSGSASRWPKVTRTSTPPSPSAAGQRIQPTSMSPPPTSSTNGTAVPVAQSAHSGSQVSPYGSTKTERACCTAPQGEHLPPSGHEEDQTEDRPRHERRQRPRVRGRAHQRPHPGTNRPRAVR